MPPPRKTRQASAKTESGPVVKLPSRRKLPEQTKVDDVDEEEEPVPSSSSRRKLRKDVSTKDLESSKIPESTSNLSNECNGSNGVPKSDSLPVNVLKRLDLLQYGPQKDRCLHIKSIKDNYVNKSIRHLSGADYAGRFTRRITSLTWHEKYPYVLASASKFGDIMLITGKPNFSSDSFEMNFETKAELQGGGAGYSVTAMKFHEKEMNILYRVSIDCTVARVDLVQGKTTQFFDTEDYNRWFCGMDVSFAQNMLLAGDNKGTGYKFSIDGKLENQWRLHKTKIHHIEFSKKDPNLLVTSSLDKSEAVRIWDARFMKNSADGGALVKPLQSLPHGCGLNCAKFSPLDGSRLLTSDQRDEIRVYQGPLWQDYLTIKHHHKQFQHITPVKADWHPVNDYIVIGRYPPATEASKKLPRAVQFFDSYTGELVDMIYPPLNEICSLNVFNPTGEYLATGMNSKLVLWKPAMSLEVGENSRPKEGDGTTGISEKMRNVLRGRRAREYSPDDDDDDEEGGASNQKKRSKTTTSSAKSAGTVAKSKAPAKPRKK